MTDAILIDRLAQRILHWNVTPDRFLIGNRSWIPKWKFNPLERLDDAFRLLDEAAPSRYAISLIDGQFRVEVELNSAVGVASEEPKPRAITLAVARGLGLEV
jgi:hypothetical protein